MTDFDFTIGLVALTASIAYVSGYLHGRVNENKSMRKVADHWHRAYQEVFKRLQN